MYLRLGVGSGRLHLLDLLEQGELACTETREDLRSHATLPVSHVIYMPYASYREGCHLMLELLLCSRSAEQLRRIWYQPRHATSSHMSQLPSHECKIRQIYVYGVYLQEGVSTRTRVRRSISWTCLSVYTPLPVRSPHPHTVSYREGKCAECRRRSRTCARFHGLHGRDPDGRGLHGREPETLGLEPVEAPVLRRELCPLPRKISHM